MSRSADVDVADRGRALVSDLVGITEPVDDPGDAHRRRRLLVLDAAERLASLAADGPALLALEDLHWCDELSLEVVAHLARRLPSLPLLVVGTLRTDELHQDAPVRAWRSRLLLQRLAEEARLPRLDLARHQPDGAASCSRSSRPSAALVELVHRAVGRSAAARRGAGERRRAGAPDGRSDVRAGDASPRRSSSASRMLSPTGQDSAVAAAVVRRSFDLDLLAAVAGRRWRMPPPASTS